MAELGFSCFRFPMASQKSDTICRPISPVLVELWCCFVSLPGALGSVPPLTLRISLVAAAAIANITRLTTCPCFCQQWIPTSNLLAYYCHSAKDFPFKFIMCVRVCLSVRVLARARVCLCCPWEELAIEKHRHSLWWNFIPSSPNTHINTPSKTPSFLHPSAHGHCICNTMQVAYPVGQKRILHKGWWSPPEGCYVEKTNVQT